MKAWPLLFVLVVTILSVPLQAQGEDFEPQAVTIGVTAGNVVFVPLKVVTTAWGFTAGALSFIVSGGKGELTQQIWQNTSQGPYFITPEIARAAWGSRPEREKE